MSSGKIIKINPALFELTRRTKKNRPEKQNISIPKPKIKTSAIKRKLLNRIKQKKTDENTINNQKNIPKLNYSELDDIDLDELENVKKELDEEDEIEDELSNAMNYFDIMSIREKEKQKILNKTYKNRNLTNPPLNNVSLNNTPLNNVPLNNLSLNIPYQLMTTENKTINTITSNILDDLPYGCLKNGTKPTYKSWMNSIKNYSSMVNTDKIDNVRPPTPPKKRKEDKINIFTENEYKESLLEEPDKHKENILKKQINDRLKKIETEQCDMLKEIDNDDVEPTLREKQYIKKIIKRKYTLGKSPKYRKVGILIKGRQTKKNIINSHKKLKHTDIHQIKKYLKKCGMLKTGSSCPDEILRKMYESAMLSGEIINTNKNTLIHNFLNDDEIIK
jgi:hypothetical protein